MKQSPKQESSKKIVIIGESPLVEEYAELCAARGFAVAAQWNTSPAGKTLPASGKRSGAVSPQTIIGIELTDTDREKKRANLEKLDRALRASKLILSSSITITITEQTAWLRHPERLVGICALPMVRSQRLVELAASPSTERSHLSAAQDFFIQLGKQISVVQDRVGMVLPRILCMLINEAYFALQDDTASPEDIDLAMKLGTNYPLGPIEWGEKIGMQHIHTVLQSLHDDLGEDRYRIAPLLKQIATSSVR